MSRHSTAHLAPVAVTVTTRHAWQADRLMACYCDRFRHCHLDGRPVRESSDSVTLVGWEPSYLEAIATAVLGERQVSLRTVGQGEGERRMRVLSLSRRYSKRALRDLCDSIGLRAPSVPMFGVELLTWLGDEYADQFAIVS